MKTPRVTLRRTQITKHNLILGHYVAHKRSAWRWSYRTKRGTLATGVRHTKLGAYLTGYLKARRYIQQKKKMKQYAEATKTA